MPNTKLEKNISHEQFWAGEFGDDYVDRNSNAKLTATKTAVFSKILSKTKDVKSALELGANIGLNLEAINRLLPECKLAGVEINEKAVYRMGQRSFGVNVFRGSIFDFSCNELGQHDLVFTAGVLIHIDPEQLQEVYERLYECSRSYICVVEYYDPQPVEVNYRGHDNQLFKRDFAGEIMDKYKDLELVDYGFHYHRDPNFPLADMTWFLMKKKDK